MKRARTGGKYILHQDFPYWRTENPVAHRVATAMVFLDDSTRETTGTACQARGATSIFGCEASGVAGITDTGAISAALPDEP